MCEQNWNVHTGVEIISCSSQPWMWDSTRCLKRRRVFSTWRVLSGLLLNNAFLPCSIKHYEVQLEKNHKWNTLPTNSTMESKHCNWVLETRGSFIYLTHRVLSVDRLITTWLSTYSSKWKFHEYLATMADVKRVCRDSKPIMYKFLISYYKLFSLCWYELLELLCFSLLLFGSLFIAFSHCQLW